MNRIRLRETLIATLLLAALTIGPASGSARAMEMTCGAGPNAFGQHVSDMAQMHGGLARATAWHNANNGGEPDLTVGEHLQLMRDMCGG